MENLRAIKERAKTIDSIIKATGAMKMVATVKLAKTNNKNKFSQESASYLLDMLRKAVYSGLQSANDYAIDMGKKGKSLLIALFPDQGFCGSFVQSLYYVTAANVRDFDKLIAIGRKSPSQFSAEFYSWEKRMDISNSSKMLQDIVVSYWAKGFRKISVVGGFFKNVLSQKGQIHSVLNLSDISIGGKEEYVKIEYPLEILINDIFNLYLDKIFNHIVAEHIVCELSARTMAMDNSVRNAKDMFKSLNSLYNRIRQTKITQELTEIISSIDGV